MDKVIALRAVSSLSAAGSGPEQCRQTYRHGRTAIALGEVAGVPCYCGRLNVEGERRLAQIAAGDPRYARIDRAALLAIAASRAAYSAAGWSADQKGLITGVAVGTSRGATSTWEEAHRIFIESGKVPVLTSPLTTAGNISSWVAQDLELLGPEAALSVTCSGALHALQTGVAWLRAGMAGRFLVGGSEAPLTGFTLAQMQALRIYASTADTDEFPCRPCSADPDSSSTFVLGEGAAIAAIEAAERADCAIEIAGVGYSVEQLSTPTSISDGGDGFFRAMQGALEDASDGGDVDAVLLHAPGTRAGDQAELAAVERLFGAATPALFSTKWIVGHTFAASGAISLEFAKLLLDGAVSLKTPYNSRLRDGTGPFRRVLVNSAGFGGNAASVLLVRDKR